MPKQQDEWVPDLRTLLWAAEQVEVDPAQLAVAIAHDVPLRVDVPAGVSHELWQAAADAAYEATWWPLMRAAKRLHGGTTPSKKGDWDGLERGNHRYGPADDT